MNLLVVDDNPDVVEGIIQNINWDKFNTEHVFSAFEAASARKILLSETIDIILCDIEMPGENGLELLSWIRSAQLPVECLFLTSYANFCYAKEALKLGSFDYILQPAPYKEIEESLLKLCQKISDNRQLEQLKKVQQYENELPTRIADGLFLDMMENGNFDAAILNRIIKLKLGVPYPSQELGIALLQIISGIDDSNTAIHAEAVFDIMQKIFTEHNLQGILLKHHACEYIVIVLGTPLKQEPFYESIQSYHAREKHSACFNSAIYLGNIIQAENFIDEINRLLHFSRNNVMRKPEIFIYSDIFTSDKEISLSSLRINRWEHYLENNRGAQIIDNIERYFASVPELPASDSLQVLQTLFWKFNSALVTVSRKKNIEYNSIFQENTFPFDSYMESYKTYELFLTALRYVISVLDTLSVHPDELKEEDIISKTISYIEDNLSQNLSRTDIANYVHLNEDYLTRIFKKRTGYMLKEFILKEKINFAKELLRNTNIAINLVAIKVGFTNFSHFSYDFKKLENMTPNEYRAKYRKE